MRIDLLGEIQRLLDRLAGFAGEPQNEGAVDDDAELVAVFGEAAGKIHPHALLDVDQDLLIAGFVADQEQTQAIILHDFEGLARNIGLGVARPRDPELAKLLRQRFDARQVVGQRVIVEKEFLHLRKGAHRPFHFRDDVFDRAHAITVSAHRLGPQTESTARFAAASRVERDIGVQQIAAEVVLDLEVALVHRRHPGKRIHVLEHRAVFVVDDDPLRVAVGKPLDAAPGIAVGDFLDGEIEFVAGDEIDGAPGDETFLGFDRDFGADEADLDVRIHRFDHLGRLHIRFE